MITPPEEASAVSAALICTSVLPQGTVTEAAWAVGLLPVEREPPEAAPAAPGEVVAPDEEPPVVTTEETEPALDSGCTCPQDTSDIRRHGAISFFMVVASSLMVD